MQFVLVFASSRAKTLRTALHRGCKDFQALLPAGDEPDPKIVTITTVDGNDNCIILSVHKSSIVYL